MLSVWQLPRQVTFGETVYEFYADFRDILEILTYLQDATLPEFIRWEIALALFYKQKVPPDHSRQAMDYLAWFLTGGCPETDKPGPKLLDWQQDAAAIVSDVNKAAGQEIRGLPFVHWWTFLSWFHAIGDGQVSTLVTIRNKLQRGKKLEGWEKDFYRQNKKKVDFKRVYTPEEERERERLQELLG